MKDKAQGVADMIHADKAVAEEKLLAAKPALEKAEAALQVGGQETFASRLDLLQHNQLPTIKQFLTVTNFQDMIM